MLFVVRCGCMLVVSCSAWIGAGAAVFAQGEQPFPAEEAAKTISLPEGFHASVVAAEPQVVQPIGFTFDGRGRLWVVEGITYPSWIDGSELRDRIVVLEDKDGDDLAETRTVFYDDGMNFTGIEVGFGGVWVCATPHLLFIPDRNGDTVPDGPPEVVLDGWDTDARHNMFNALRWGPDGWLYGCNGILSNSKVGAPGTPDDERVELNCGVWRYHPTKKIVEAVAHGTTNPWGLDFDEHGQMFITNCVIKHLFHVIPGAHYDRMFGQGVNQHVYSLIESCADHRHWGEGHWTDSRGGIGEHDKTGGGHAHAGCMIYLGDNWPSKYRGTLFTCNIHGQRLNNDILEREGSGYIAYHGDDFLKFSDPWYRGLEMKYGPDGSVYLSDWSDIGECHDYDGHIARDNGRIYKITYGETKPIKVNVPSLIDSELVDLLGHDNAWFARQAQHELQQRGVTRKFRKDIDEALHAKLNAEDSTVHRLRALWTLHATGGLTDDTLAMLLNDDDEHLRYWAVTLELEDREASDARLEQLYEMAESDASPLVRLALASGLQRLGEDQRWELARRLSVHDEDADDHNLPLMLWYGVEPLVMSDLDHAMKLVSTSKIPVLRRFIARRMTVDTVSETATATSKETPLNQLVKFLAAEKNPDVQRDALVGIAEALEGRRDVPMPPAWPSLVMSIEAGTSDVAKESALTLSVTFGDPQALNTLRKRVTDTSLDTATRQQALSTLTRKHDAKTSKLMQKLLKQANAGEGGPLRAALLRGFAVYDDAEIPQLVLAGYKAYSDAERQDAINTLAVRPAWASSLLQAVKNGTVPPRDITTVTARQIYELRKPELQKLLAEVWGDFRDTSQEKQQLIAQYKSKLTPEVLMQADRIHGREVFSRTCAGCHKLFDAGRSVGPELTGAQRDNIDYLLTNLLAPSAVVSRSYLLNIIVTTDGRILTGVVKEETPKTITLLTANDTIIVSIADIEEGGRAQSQVSMMPEGMLDKLSETEVRDLIGYLSGAEQVPLPAGASK